MDREETIRLLQAQANEDRMFLKEPREVAPLPEEEEFDWWGNIIDFYGLEKIQDFFGNMFKREPYRKAPTTIDPRYGKQGMRIIKEVLEE